MMRLKQRIPSKTNIPTSSMSDIAFLLLLFFLVTTKFRKEIGFQVILPEARATERIIKTEDLARIFINSKGQISVDDFLVQPSDVVIRFRLKIAENPAMIAYIKADKRVKYNYVDQVLESLREAKALRVIFATEFKEGLGG
ncbi:MAG TPA: biopolymer transporter ExbD [Candidatus Hydrothermia bacterium]|nr:biopolymer transporter ExbD [Candidatus Hydrothermae bacterium]MDD3648842.1 biopolymer transporter ExbD [Candidatus Hydrothermia bacterium]MDD5572340.1 biopolymer transporter ExbD [Candidatus Hydrothermia bacterium]HOK23346.1 biopolymer transporter ExbD [Candidatus Hydrothermia bacterium]HOL24156.1 biopolymer transporter ExbD [Candidatus Hydrothermia bacterium]